MEDVVVDFGVDVFGVYEQAVDVEDAGADGWEVVRRMVGGVRHGSVERKGLAICGTSDPTCLHIIQI